MEYGLDPHYSPTYFTPASGQPDSAHKGTPPRPTPSPALQVVKGTILSGSAQL